MRVGGYLEMNPTPLIHNTAVRQFYFVECYDSQSHLKWTDKFENLVVTVGLNYYLDAALKTGVASPLFSVGLKGTGAVVAADTIASHGNWLEGTWYSNGTRPPWTAGTIGAGSVTNSVSKAVFNIDAVGTVWGAFLIGPSGWGTIKAGTIGTLIGAGDFSTAPRVVQVGDTLNVTITCTQTAS